MGGGAEGAARGELPRACVYDFRLCVRKQNGLLHLQEITFYTDKNDEVVIKNSLSETF